MTIFRKVFGETKPIIGMVHLRPLPGAPGYEGNLESVFKCALQDLQALERGGATAFIVENFGDIPYASSNSLITITSFTAIAARLRQYTKLPMGINVQFNEVDSAWSAAYAAEADFIRVEVFAETRVGPNGMFTAAGPHLMRLKQSYPKEIALLCDLNVKHTFALADQPLDFTIESIIEGGGDAIIENGLVTGKSPSIDEVRETKHIAGDFPVIVGSGVKAETAKEYFEACDGAIIGSSFKVDGNVMNGIDEARVRRFVNALKS